MIRLYGSNYTYLSLQFLSNSIDPPCTDFEAPLNRKKCKNCNMRVACRDLSRLIQLCEKITAEMPSTGKRIKSLYEIDKNLTMNY